MNEIVHHSMPRHDISKESAVAVAFAKERAYYFWSCVYSVALHFQQRKSVANASPCAAIVSGSQTFRYFQLIVTLFLVAPFLSTHFPGVFVCVESNNGLWQSYRVFHNFRCSSGRSFVRGKWGAFFINSCKEQYLRRQFVPRSKLKI